MFGICNEWQFDGVLADALAVECMPDKVTRRVSITLVLFATVRWLAIMKQAIHRCNEQVRQRMWQWCRLSGKSYASWHTSRIAQDAVMSDQIPGSRS